MPVHAGRPVGWLNLNNLHGGVGGSIARSRAQRAWRAAAYNALSRRRLPTNLGRVYVQVQFRFQTNRSQDPSNYELTVKPVIDALQPTRSYPSRNRRTGRTKLVVEPGIGMIPNDSPQHLVRGPEMPVGEPLGRSSQVKGIVILFITPLPAEENP